MSFRLTPPEPTEADVQRAVMQVLLRHPKVGVAWRANSGVARLVGKGGVKRPVRFGFVGQPDVIGHLNDGRALYIEVKRPSGVLTPEQRAFIEEAALRGCIAFVARSVDDVIEALEGV